MIRFVGLMEGHIWIESEGIGKGSTAVFIVKLGFPERSSDCKHPFLPQMPVNQGQTKFHGLRVLLLDSNGSVTSKLNSELTLLLKLV